MRFPSGDVDWNEVEAGAIASRLHRVGQLYWWICDFDETIEDVMPGTCTPPRAFNIKFRLRTLLPGDALTHASRVYSEMAGEAFEANARCHRISRTRQRCRVDGFAGDTVIYGHVTLWNRRPSGIRTYDRTRYRATLRVYDEYCHLVQRRPKSECDEPYKRRTGWRPAA